MLNDLLDIAKIESGKMEFASEAIVVKELFKDILDAFIPAARSKNICLTIDYELKVPEKIKTDPVRLRQVVFNLLSNAVKFTENGSVSVVVHCDPIHDSHKGNLVVLVKDSGIGMTPEALTRMFKPFEQADATLARKHGGTGLGLAISRYLAEAMGGSLSVESELGSGSTFRAEFCVEISSSITSASPEAGSTDVVRQSVIRNEPLDCTNEYIRPAPPEPESGKMRILLAEDGPDNQKLIKWMLERKFGADVTLVDDGVKAVEQAILAEIERPFDLVLMDVQMPILDGLSATKQLRERKFSKPIIALTAHASQNDIDSSIEAGCNFHISKPIDWEKLKVAIQSVRRIAPQDNAVSQIDGPL